MEDRINILKERQKALEGGTIPTPEAVILIERLRWEDSPRCPHGHKARRTGREKQGWPLYYCTICSEQFKATTGTHWHTYTGTPQDWLKLVVLVKYRLAHLSAASSMQHAAGTHGGTIDAHLDDIRLRPNAGLCLKSESLGLSRPKPSLKQVLQARLAVAEVLAERGSRLRRSEVFKRIGGETWERAQALEDLGRLPKAQLPGLIAELSQQLATRSA